MPPPRERDDERQWHLDRKVPLALIVTIIAQTMIAAWAASNIWTRVGELEHKVEIAAPRPNASSGSRPRSTASPAAWPRSRRW